MKEAAFSRLKLIAAMSIFGTVGLARRYIPLSSGLIACVRGLVGGLFLLFVLAVKRRKIAWNAVKENGLLLPLSGALIGINWILLFEAYKYTTVATATLFYYMAPVIVVLASPLVLKERLTLGKLMTVVISLGGMLLVSGVFSEGGIRGPWGILFALGAAFFYACVILLNKKLKPIEAYDKTVVQLFCAAAVLLPYLLVTEDATTWTIMPLTAVLLLVVGILHTGVAYALYFGSFEGLSAQTVAVVGYIDPVVAVLLSALLLREPMSLSQGIGAVLILVASLGGELLPTKEKKK